VELRQLIYFDAVIREGGFTKAARQLHVAQPAISAQVRQLEAELGVTLIQRGTRSPVLTQAGELLLVHARQVLAHIEAARLEMAGISSVTKGTVRIGATQVLGAFNLAASMASFRLRYPGVAMTTATGPGAPVATCELVRLPRHPPITVITPSKRTAPATRAFADYLRHRASLTLMTDRKSRA
jgi:DNA-binding transcriptional LysR family regulator